MQEILTPLCEWLAQFLVAPALQLASLSDAALRLIPGIVKPSEHSFEGSTPFDAAVVQIEWISRGAVMPLKYETFGRLVVQVCGNEDH